MCARVHLLRRIYNLTRQVFPTPTVFLRMELRVFCVRFRSHPIYRPILIKHRGYCRGLKMTMEWVAIWTNTGKHIRCFYWTWHRLGDDSRNYTTFVVLAHQGNPSRILFFRSTWFPASFDPFIQLLKESLQDSLDGLNIYSPILRRLPAVGSCGCRN